jgi:hypothetical protein
VNETSNTAPAASVLRHGAGGPAGAKAPPCRPDLLEELEAGLPPHLRAARAMRRSRRMSPLLAAALANACECEGRTPTVGELARLAGVNRVTLDRHWRHMPGGPPPCRLLDVLGWIVLLRAREAYTDAGAWTRAAPRAGTSRNTVARLAASLAGMSVLEVENDPRELVRRFEERVLRHLA